MVSELIGAAGGIAATLATVYGVYVGRKSKRERKFGEDEQMIENADKIVSMWEKLSANYINELKELKDKYDRINKQYNDLRVEFEVEKRQNGFLIKQYEMQVSQKDAEISILKTEVENLRTIVGQGMVKPIGIVK